MDVTMSGGEARDSEEWPTAVQVSCPAKPSLAERALLSDTMAREVEQLFKVLANDTRIRLVHALARAGELRVSDLAEAVGMSTQAVSNQLQGLELRGMVASRRRGTSVIYRIQDACVVEILERSLCLLEESAGRRQVRHNGVEVG